jgi:hypothetical protein
MKVPILQAESTAKSGEKNIGLVEMGDSAYYGRTGSTLGMKVKFVKGLLTF